MPPKKAAKKGGKSKSPDNKEESKKDSKKDNKKGGKESKKGAKEEGKGSKKGGKASKKGAKAEPKQITQLDQESVQSRKSTEIQVVKRTWGPKLDQIDRVIRCVSDFPIPGSLRFKDISPVLMAPDLGKIVMDEFVSRLQVIDFDVILGLEARGFIFGYALAQKLQKPFIICRKAGKLPGDKVQYEYKLEFGYARIEIPKDAIKEGQKVLIHDDVLATGGTAAAAAELTTKVGGEVAGFIFLVEFLYLPGKERLNKYSDNIISLLDYDES